MRWDSDLIQKQTVSFIPPGKLGSNQQNRYHEYIPKGPQLNRSYTPAEVTCGDSHSTVRPELSTTKNMHAIIIFISYAQLMRDVGWRQRIGA